MQGKRMPDKLRAKAVGLALVAGVPDAAKAMGVSQRNIRRWKLDPELSELVLSAREELLNAMKAVMWVGLDEVHKGLASPEEPLKSKSDALFGLIDRHQLLSGEATARTESMNPALPPEVQRALRERFIEVTRDRAVGLGDGLASEGQPEGPVSTSA